VIRRLFNAASALSLLLCVGTVSFWIAGLGDFRFFEPYQTNDGWVLTVSSESGEFCADFHESRPDYTRPPTNRGFYYEVKCWKVAGPLGVLPLVWITLLLAHTRAARRSEKRRGFLIGPPIRE
jgi:hypothetical protein